MTSRHTGVATAASCRKLMQAGRRRPTMRACCARADCLTSTGHSGFVQVAALHRAAIDDAVIQLGQANFDERKARKERWSVRDTMLDRRPGTEAVPARARACAHARLARCLRRIANSAKPAHDERQAAEIETRPPGKWAADAPAERHD